MAFVHKGRSLGVYGRLIDLGGYRGLYVKVWEFHLDLATIGFISWHDSYRNHLHRVIARDTGYKQGFESESYGH